MNPWGTNSNDDYGITYGFATGSAQRTQGSGRAAIHPNITDVVTIDNVASGSRIHGTFPHVAGYQVVFDSTVDPVVVRQDVLIQYKEPVTIGGGFIKAMIQFEDVIQTEAFRGLINKEAQYSFGTIRQPFEASTVTWATRPSGSSLAFEKAKTPPFLTTKYILEFDQAIVRTRLYGLAIRLMSNTGTVTSDASGAATVTGSDRFDCMKSHFIIQSI